MCAGVGNYAEAIRVTFDPDKVSFAQLLDVFFSMHAPHASPSSAQYRNAVWPQNAEQERTTSQAVAVLEKTKGRRVYTSVERLDTFHDAEWYHQSYNAKNKIRLSLFALLFALNMIPVGSFPGQAALKTGLGCVVFASLLPQLIPGFDKLLAVFE